MKSKMDRRGFLSRLGAFSAVAATALPLGSALGGCGEDEDYDDYDDYLEYLEAYQDNYLDSKGYVDSPGDEDPYIDYFNSGPDGP